MDSARIHWAAGGRRGQTDARTDRGCGRNRGYLRRKDVAINCRRAQRLVFERRARAGLGHAATASPIMSACASRRGDAFRHSAVAKLLNDAAGIADAEVIGSLQGLTSPIHVFRLASYAGNAVTD